MTVLCCIRAVVQPQVAPENAATDAWERLAKTRSFAFHVSFETDVPFRMAAELVGAWQTPDRESWTGRWRRQDTWSRVRVMAAGDRQYDMTSAGWNRSPRGTETRILDQLRALMPAGSAVFRRESAGAYLYEFPAKSPVIDPARTKRLAGVLAVSRSSGLPLFVRCSDESGAARWDVTFSRFNRARPVELPFVASSVVRAFPQRRLSCSEYRRASATVSERLRRAGWESRLSRAGRGLSLELEETRSRALLELLLSVGRVELWSAVNADQAPGDSVRLVANDAARRVVLRRPLGSNNLLQAQPDLSLPFAPRLRLELADPVASGASSRDSTSLLALTVNGEVMGVASPGPDGLVTFGDVGDARMLAAVAGLCAGPELPVGFEVQEVRERPAP